MLVDVSSCQSKALKRHDSSNTSEPCSPNQLASEWITIEMHDLYKCPRTQKPCFVPDKMKVSANEKHIRCGIDTLLDSDQCCGIHQID